MNCPKCDNVLVDDWRFCPECGEGFSGSMMETSETYLMFRDVNLQPIMDGFESIKGLGLMGSTDSTLREELGDYGSIDLFQLMYIPLVSYVPSVLEDIFKISKLVGYYMVYPTTQQMMVKQYLAMFRGLNPTRIPKDALILQALKKSWIKNRIGVVEKVTADGDDITFTISEVGCSIKAFESNYCALAANLCGMAEALTGMLWTGELNSCGHECEGCCEVTITPGDEPFVKEDLSKNKYSQITDKLIDSIIQETPLYPRPNLGNDFHLSLHQILNYLMLNASDGHKIMYLHFAQKTGELLAKKTQPQNTENAIQKLDKIFIYLKAGRIQQQDQKIILTESALSTQTDTEKPLDEYLVALIQGYLNNENKEKIKLEEIKCISQGNTNCEIKIG